VSPREERLAELGLHLPEVTPPLAAYVPAVRSGNLVFVSGQLPMVDGQLQLAGKVGADVTVEQAKGLAQRCALNALAAAAEMAGGLEKIVRVVKLVGYVACEPAFIQQPQVVNGASELLGHVLGDAGKHSRVAVGVAALPLGAPVEVELVVEVAG
jgi:enamine deaminase RidA (YjgF/YER057c/UK114 family)